MGLWFPRGSELRDLGKILSVHLKSSFPKSIESLSLTSIRKWPKGDLHNHCLMGGRMNAIEKFYGKKIQKFKPRLGTIQELDQWIATVYRPVLLHHPDAFRLVVEAAFQQAKNDGIRVLEMSLDSGYGQVFGLTPEKVITILSEAHHRIAPEIDFKPELGFIRGKSIRKLLLESEPYFDSGFFKSIDLYDDEMVQPLKNFRELYRFARKAGMKCKAHTGEYGDAYSVKETVETLELDAVQHGLRAAESPEVMRWLADHHIPLNICPASNIRLKRVRSYKTHPIRILFDNGIKVTINTDDVLVFGMGVSEQMRRLYTAGNFTAEELDIIRQNGLD